MAAIAASLKDVKVEKKKSKAKAPVEEQVINSYFKCLLFSQVHMDLYLHHQIIKARFLIVHHRLLLLFQFM